MRRCVVNSLKWLFPPENPHFYLGSFVALNADHEVGKRTVHGTLPMKCWIFARCTRGIPYLLKQSKRWSPKEFHLFCPNFYVHVSQFSPDIRHVRYLGIRIYQPGEATPTNTLQKLSHWMGHRLDVANRLTGCSDPAPRRILGSSGGAILFYIKMSPTFNWTVSAVPGSLSLLSLFFLPYFDLSKHFLFLEKKKLFCPVLCSVGPWAQGTKNGQFINCFKCSLLSLVH